MTLDEIQAAIESENFETAPKELHEYLSIHPDSKKALFLLGQMYIMMDRPAFALPIYEQLKEKDKNRKEIWNNLARCYDSVHLNDKAQAAYKKCIRLDPSYIRAYSNLATSYVSSCKPKQSQEWNDKARAMNPTETEILDQIEITESWIKLMTRDYSGWDEYQVSIGKTAEKPHRKYDDEPDWNGEKGAKVIIYGQEGMGDEICFASMIPDLVKDCTTYLDCHPRLEGLFKRSFPEVEVHGTRLSMNMEWPYEKDFTHSLSIGVLGKFYRRRVESFPGTPFLTACPNRRAQWKALFDKESKGRLKVGLAWSGGSAATKSAQRTKALKGLEPILAQDAYFVSLEYKDGETDPRVNEYPWGAKSKDMDDVAAMIAELDLVIAVPTTSVHLAGGLGIPTLLLTDKHPHFLFGLEGSKCDWYGSVEQIRTNQIQQTAEKLHGYIHRARPEATNSAHDGVLISNTEHKPSTSRDAPYISSTPYRQKRTDGVYI